MSTYEDRLMRVLTYIHDNADGDLSLDRLADEAAMSRFHWHRVYRAMTGETCAQTVRRVRLYRAAADLVQTGRDIGAIASASGYSNVKSFARAFSETFGMSPAAFRGVGVPPPNPAPGRVKEHHMYPVEIIDVPARRLAAMPHTGAYHTVSRAFDQLSGLFSARNLWPQARGMVMVSCDDPDTVPEADLRSYAAIEIPDGVQIEAPMVVLTLPAGRHAVLHHQGPYVGLKPAYDYLYGQWFPASGEEPADTWPYELYANSPMDTAPEDLRTDICVALR